MHKKTTKNIKLFDGQIAAITGEGWGGGIWAQLATHPSVIHFPCLDRKLASLPESSV